MSTAILVIAALLPAVLLCTYVFKKDKVEKEPIGLLSRLLLFGALSCIPILVLEIIFEEVLNVFVSQASMPYLYNFFSAFFGVALIEESVKFLFLYYATRKHKAFNSFFDGLIYSIFVSLGFAAVENVLYVIENGFATAIMRAILSVPGHMFFAVMMGYHYSCWNIFNKANLMENELKCEGLIPSNTPKTDTSKHLFYAVFTATACHGFYDFCLFNDSLLLLVADIAFVIFMYVYCFGKIKKMSSGDALTHDYAKLFLIKKHPDISLEIRSRF